MWINGYGDLPAYFEAAWKWGNDTQSVDMQVLSGNEKSEKRKTIRYPWCKRYTFFSLSPLTSSE
jgi:hypothetical protein